MENQERDEEEGELKEEMERQKSDEEEAVEEEAWMLFRQAGTL